MQPDVGAFVALRKRKQGKLPSTLRGNTYLILSDKPFRVLIVCSDINAARHSSITAHTLPMTSLLETAGRKLFAAHIEQYAPADPLYEYYVDKKGRKKRRKVVICKPFRSYFF
jgi:hypothetical protein